MKNQLLKFISYLFILFGNDLFSQLPSELNHPSNIILKRLSANGLLNLDYFGKNNLSAIEIDKILKNNSSDIIIRSLWDIRPPSKDTVNIPTVNKNKFRQFYKSLTLSNLKNQKNYLYQSFFDSTSIWLSIGENISFQPDQSTTEFQFIDNITVNGIIDNKIFLSSSFSMLRHSGHHIWISDDYKDEWTKYFPDINMTFWYRNYTSLYLKSHILDMEFSNRPFSWGWSSGNSPILSAKAVPFNRFSIYKKVGNFNFEYFHGSLLDQSINEIHLENSKIEKFIAGHRAQYILNDNLNFSFSELVVYGNRSPELGYLNPISFFWSQEHNMGDLDNILLAFDFGYRALPGIIFYNTLVLDELSWQDLFSNWWGNKYSYQLGMFISSKNMKMPDLRIEYTATRPWTYTHPDFSYTHRGLPLGTINGPSNISFRLESFYLPSPKLIIQFSFENVQKGIGTGSMIHDNYDNRNKEDDWETEFLLGQYYSKNTTEINLSYYITNMIKLKGTLKAKQLGNHYEIIYEDLNEINKEFILGLEMKW